MLTAEVIEEAALPDTTPLVELKIAYCLPQYKQPGSSDTSYLQQVLIADGLRSAGHRLTFIAPANLVDVVCTSDLETPALAARTWSRAIWFDIASRVAWRFQKLLGIPYLNVFSNYRLMDACLQCLPGHDIVQERNGLYKAGVAMACRRLGLPYILFFDGDDIYEHAYNGKPITGILRWRAKQTIRFNIDTADRVICVSDTAKAHLINEWDVPEEKIVVFPNGVDINLHRPYPEDRHRFRSQFGLNDGDPLLIFVGSFYPWQDLHVLLDAYARFLTVSPAAHLLMVGDGQQAQAAKQYADKLNLQRSVHFTGFLPQHEVARLVSAADIAVAPYKAMQPELFYGSSMKVFEYMASGTAVVATAQGQISEVIQDGVNGMLVAPGDVEALAAILGTLTIDYRLRERLGQNARQDAIAKHSWTRYTSRLEMVYESVINSRSRR